MTAGSERGVRPVREIPSEDISFYGLLTPLVRHWKLVVGTALGVAAIAAVILLLQRPTYTGRATFTPEASTGSGAGSGLGAFLGVASELGFGVSAGSVSPEFFVRLAGSGEVLRSTLQSEFTDPQASGGARRPLLEILEVPGDGPEERLQNGVILLGKRIEASVDKPTGIVALEVEMGSPQLAADVANHLVKLLNQFNLERRQSQSREQRRFTGERMAEAERDLRAAERAELAFLQRNRDYSSSPLLTFEAGRLARDVQVKQELFLTLSKAHTEARIAEVRDTPVLTVVDSAVAPVRRTSPRRTIGVIIAGLVGVMLGIGLAYLASTRDRPREQRADYLEFREALETARRGVSRQ
ncbi:MAG TPA: GNVR domain-containing protein [Gemmatimonadales bacterium]|nr:GNVR domain-containing protein [Gemmatimonadales bacterium]